MTDYGFGGRLAFNLTRHVALEGELNLLPRELPAARSRTQGLFGFRVGKRFNRIGIFGKARPGFVYYSKNEPPGPLAATPGKALLALDLGAVLEINHSRRVFTRFDFGDTMIRTNILMSETSIRTRGRHDMQFSAGLGFRF